MRRHFGQGPRPRGGRNYPVRYISNNPVRFNNNSGSVDPNRIRNNTNSGTRYQPTRPQGSYNNQGGRGRGPTSGRYNGRFGGQQNGRGRFQPNQGRGGGFTGQQFGGNPYHRPEAYYQDEEEIPTDSVPDQPEPEEQIDEQYADMTEEELEQAWNENLFLEEPEEFYAQEEEYEDDGEYYEELAAHFGSTYV